MADRVTTGSDSRNFRGKPGCLCKWVSRGDFFNAYCIAPITGAGILAAKFEIGEITCFQKQLQTN